MRLTIAARQARFCGVENIKTMRTGSDYRDRTFGKDWGTLIEELMIMARAVYVLDAGGKIVYGQIVPEVTDEPNYDGAMTALQGLLG